MSEMALKRVLTDASSAILLFKAGLAETATALYQMILSDAVYGELTGHRLPGAEFFRGAVDGGLIHRRTVGGEAVGGPGEVREIADSLSERSMGAGERETILLYLEGAGDFVLIDDRRGAAFCRDNGVPYINALLVPRILFIAGHLHKAAMVAATDRVLSLGRYSDAIAAYARNLSNERLAVFAPDGGLEKGLVK